MKKLLSIILVLAMALSLVSAVSAAPVAEKYDATSIVNVTGKVESGTYVNLILFDEATEEIKHVQEVKPELDGSYRAKFKFKNSTDGLTLAVKQDGADVTNSVITAVAEESKIFSYLFGATTLSESTKAIAEFKNYFNVEGKTYVLMVAFYDAEGKLIGVKTTDKKNVEFNETKTDLIVDIPEGTDKIKSFMWDSIEKMIPLAKEKTTKPVKEIKVLAIGNSFTHDPTEYLAEVAAADGIQVAGTKINLTHANHSGSSIWQHWYYAAHGLGFYGTKVEGTGDAKTPTNRDADGVWLKTLQEYLNPALNGGKIFDIITFQQVSGDSGKIETYGFAEEDPEGTYDHCAEELVKIIRTYQPTAEIVLQQTWAYEVGYGGLKSYSADKKSTDLAAQTAMFEGIEHTVKTACERLAKVTTDDGKPISLDGKPLRYIPTGQAFQNARQAEMFKTTYDASKKTEGSSSNPRYPYSIVTLHRDGFHSSERYGRYLGALVWYGALTGNSPAANKYKHTVSEKGVTYDVDEEAEAILKNAAQDALDSYGRWN